MKISDTLLGLFFVALSAAILWTVSGYPKMPGQDVGPAMFPGLGAGLLGLFGAVMVARQAFAGGRPRLTIQLGAWSRSPRHVAAGMSVVVGCALYAAIAHKIGFVLVMPFLLFVWHVLFGVRLTISVISAVVTTLAVWVLFYKLLGVPLPWGLLKNYAF